MSERIRPTWFWAAVILMLAGLILAAFGPGWRGQWILDDVPQVAANPYLENWSEVFDLVSHSVWETTGRPSWSPIYRPTMMVSFLALRQLFGLCPAAFHLWNWLIHLVNVLLLGWLARRFFKKGPMWLLLTSLFAVHPLVGEAVLWVGGLQDLYSLTFALLLFATLWVDHPVSWRRWALAGLFFFLALLSKEISLFLPLPLAAWLLAREEGAAGRPRPWKALTAVSLISLGIYLLIRRAALGTHTFHSGYWGGHFVADLKLTLAIFLRNFFWPDPLKFHRPFSPGDLGTGLSLALVLLALAVLLIGFWRWRRKSDGRLLFASTLIMYPLIPAAMFAGVTRLMPERYFYVPIAGGMLALGCLIDILPRGWLWPKRIMAGLASAGLLLSLSASRWYARQWRNQETLFVHALQHPPVSYEIYYDLGREAVEQNRLPEAEGWLRQSLERWPGYRRAMNDLAVTLLRQGRPAEALFWFDRLLRLDPAQARYHYNRGQSLQLLNRNREAADSYSRCLALNPVYPRAREMLRLAQTAAAAGERQVIDRRAP